MRFDSLLRDGRQADALQVRRSSNVANAVRQDRDVHAQADLRRQRVGHAHAPVAVEGRRAAVLRRGRATRGLSDMARWYIGGLLTHAPALLAFSNPTTNSYQRLVPGYEAPVNLVYSQRNRSAACRIPLVSASRPKAKRVEFRVPDPSCNPYLAFSAMLMAGLDGVQQQDRAARPGRQGHLRPPPRGAARACPPSPPRLEEALAALEDDHEFMLEGGVFTDRPHRDLHRLQDGQRGQPAPPPPAPARVRAVLRHLITWPADLGF